MIAKVRLQSHGAGGAAGALGREGAAVLCHGAAIAAARGRLRQLGDPCRGGANHLRFHSVLLETPQCNQLEAAMLDKSCS